jgi:hypothetical protein
MYDQLGSDQHLLAADVTSIADEQQQTKHISRSARMPIGYVSSNSQGSKGSC